MNTDTIPERLQVSGEEPESPETGEKAADEVGGELVSNTGATAVHAEPDTDVALTEHRFQGSFEDESALESGFEAWEALSDHERVVTLVDWELGDGTARMATETADAGTLRDYLEVQDTVVWVDEAVWMVDQLAAAVEAGHEEGTLHLEIDPSWVYLRATPPDVPDVPKLGGWGVAQYAREDSSGVQGSDPAYAAPEQFDGTTLGDPDERTDLYRLGTLLYRLLAGRAPFTGTGYEVLRAKLLGSPIDPPSEVTGIVPEALDEVVSTALATDPDDRYDSVGAFREALADVEIPAAASGSSVTGTWPQYGGGPTRRGLADAEDGEGEAPEDRWLDRITGEVSATPAVAYGTAYVAGDDGSIVAYRADSGEQRWVATPEDYAIDDEDVVGTQEYDVEQTPAVVDGTVVFTSDEGLFALDARDGSKCWSREQYEDDRRTVDLTDANGRTGRTLWTPRLLMNRVSCVAGVDGTAYVPAHGDTNSDDTSRGVYALDVESGETEWFVEIQDDFPDDGPVSATVGDDLLVVNTRDGITAFDLETRQREWEFSGYGGTPASIVDGRVYCGDDDNLYALDAATGRREWQASAAYQNGVQAVGEGAVYVSCSDGLKAIDADSGDELWVVSGTQIHEDRAVTSEPVVTADTVFVSINTTTYADTDTSEVAALSTDGGHVRWHYDIGGNNSIGPTVVDDTVVTGNEHNDVTAISVPETTDLGAEEDEEQIDDRSDTEKVVDALRETDDNQLDVDFIPDETGLTDEAVTAAVDELVADGIVERDEWEGMVDIVLVRDPDAGEDGPDATSEDREELLDVIETSGMDGQMIRDTLHMETGWTETKTDEIVDDLVAAGELRIQEMGGNEMIAIDETGTVGGVDVAAGQARPTADELRAAMSTPDLAEALEAAVQNAKPDGSVEMIDAMDDLPSNEDWGQLVANGYLVQDGAETVVDLPDAVDFEFQG